MAKKIAPVTGIFDDVTNTLTGIAQYRLGGVPAVTPVASYTAAQQTAGAVGVAGVTAAGVLVGPSGSPVSGGDITTVVAVADTGPHPHLTSARISDGDEIGTPVVWWSPTGSGGFWGYSISPTDKFGV